MDNYEITTGTFREDYADYNIIKLLNHRRANKLSVGHFKIEGRITATNINTLIKNIYSKLKIDLPYCVSTFQSAEIYEDDFIIVLQPDFELRTIDIIGFGCPEKTSHYHKTFSKLFPNKQSDIKMSWYYTGNRGGMESTDIPLIEDKEKTAVSSHYPFIKPNLDTYIENFHNSNNSILLLTGEPGTGKTSFIRHYITTYMLNSMVTYDESIMMRDEFYINFLTSSKKHILVVEDADVFLLSRDGGENKIMSKFLNVADGLVKGMNKKIIFSTNLTQLNQIDSAIIRPGRCFDVLEFRKLNLKEANVVCNEHNLPELTENIEYSLADIFNRSPRSLKAKKIGF